MEAFLYFLAGALAFNSIPHLVKGITGEKHMTPFRRVSSPVLNVLWGFVNLLACLYVLRLAGGAPGLVLVGEANLKGANLVAFLAGGFVTSIWLAFFWSDPSARLPWHRD